MKQANPLVSPLGSHGGAVLWAGRYLYGFFFFFWLVGCGWVRLSN